MDIWSEPPGPEPSWSISTRRFCARRHGSAEPPAAAIQMLFSSMGIVAHRGCQLPRRNRELANALTRAAISPGSLGRRSLSSLLPKALRLELAARPAGRSCPRDRQRESGRGLRRRWRIRRLKRPAGEVQLAALAAVHGRKSCRARRSGGPSRRRFRPDRRSSCGAESLEVGGVEADEVVLVVVEAEHLRGEGFKGAKQLAVVLDDKGHIGAGQLDIDLARFDSLRGRVRRRPRVMRYLRRRPPSLFRVVRNPAIFCAACCRSSIGITNKYRRAGGDGGTGEKKSRIEPAGA